MSCGNQSPGFGSDLARTIVAELEPNPARAVAAWSQLPARALEVDWPQVLALAIQHRVEGLFTEAAELAGFDDQIPPSISSTLRRRADLAEVRQQALCDAFRSLAGIAPALTSDLIVYKGITLIPQYEKPRHRMVSDVDLLVLPETVPRLRDVFATAGYRERPTPSGPAFVGPSPISQIGCDFVVFDVHIDPLPRFLRPPQASHIDWLDASDGFELAGFECRQLSPELELLVALVYLGEHALSWIHACLEDDVRLIKIFDVELLCALSEVSASLLLRRAQALELEGSMALGLAVILSVRTRLPDALLPLRPMADDVRDLLDSVALPGGRIARWDRPFSVRAFETDRCTQALKLMPPGRQGRREWHDIQSGPNTGAEDVAAVTAAARARVTSHPGS